MRDAVQLPPIAIRPRIASVRSEMQAAGIDALLVTNLSNIRYLSGFTGSAAMLLVTQEASYLGTDARYAESAERQVAVVGADLVIARPEAQLKALSAKLGPGIRLGLEADHLSWASAEKYRSDIFAEQRVVACSEVVERVRLIKDDAEIARMRFAAGIASQSLGETLVDGLVGRTERELAIAIERKMVDLGASGPSFDTIVATAANAAMPHAKPGKTPVEEGDLVIFDLGARFDGYCSDMTRTVPAGEISARSREILDLVTQAQQQAVATVADGVPSREVDNACREAISAAGFGEAFVHGTGHGVGLDIHEEIYLGPLTAQTLRQGMVVTIEPGVYLPDDLGVRIEDMVLVESDCAQSLTTHPKF